MIDPDGTLHELYTATIICEGRSLGTFQYDSGRIDLSWPRHGWGYYCRWCGKVWAVISATDPRGAQMSFDPIVATCERHKDQWELPGTLLYPPVSLLIDSLPPEAIKREFQLHLTNAEKELAYDQETEAATVP